jgi:hypothetical protein
VRANDEAIRGSPYAEYRDAVTDRVWTADEANAALAWVTGMVERARRAAHELRERVGSTQERVSSNGHGGIDHPLVDDLGAVVGELAAEGITLRDVERGLVDFAASAPSGRPYWLCWVVGEPSVDWWHWPEDGFAGRTPLSDPPT